MRNIERVEILNESVDLLDFDTALECARELALDRQKVSYVVAVNPEKVMTARRSKIIHDFICRADLAIPDGIGIVAAVSMLFGKKIERVAGADLMQKICEESGKEGIKIFLYGAKEDVNAGAVEVLRKRYPDIQIVGRQNGYLPESESDDLVARVNASDADVLFLALGSPRQEKWMNQYGDKLRVGMCMGVGGTLDTIVGKVKRAPMAWQRARLEWLYRLIRQPSRFWRQRRIFYFAARVLLEKALHPKISK
ncbi:MAG: WecB/TagA/CpsF family glycosyltransferase [Thermoguttaceae bacterium]